MDVSETDNSLLWTCASLHPSSIDILLFGTLKLLVLPDQNESQYQRDGSDHNTNNSVCCSTWNIARAG